VHPKPLVTGADLIAAGYKPGPQFKEILGVLEDAQLEGRLRTKEDGMRLVEEQFPRKAQASSWFLIVIGSEDFLACRHSGFLRCIDGENAFSCVLGFFLWKILSSPSRGAILFKRKKRKQK
jgi:hypothetical protein